MSRGAAAWGPPMIGAGVVFALSSVPGDSYPAIGIWSFDKLVHGVVYGVLGALIFRGLRRTTELAAVPAVMVAAAIATGYGVTDELHQLFVRNRSCDWRDAVADAVGGLLGALLLAGWCRGRKLRAEARA